MAVAVPKVVAHAHSAVGLQLEACRRVLHDHVHHAACGIALHVGRERFRHHNAVHQVGGEYVERYVAVFVVGRGYLYAVHQRVVVALVHAAQYGVRCLARCALLKRYARHALQHGSHIDVGRQLYALLAHHVEHIAGILFKTDGTDVGAAVAVACHYGLAKAADVLVEGNGHGARVRHLNWHLAGFIGQVSYHQCVTPSVGQFVQAE